MGPGIRVQPPFLNQRGTAARQIAGWLFPLTGMGLSILAESRAFLLGFTLSYCIWLYVHFLTKKKQKKYLFLGLVTALLLLLIVLSCFFKTGSSQGRLLIYKLTLKVITDHPWAGVGWGKFPLVYGTYQQDYFRQGRYTQQELLLADDSKHAFNDYLQLISEIGIPQALTMFMLLLFLLTRIFKKMTAKPPALQQACVTTVITLLTAALFTHIFEHWYFQVVFLTAVLGLVPYTFFNQARVKYGLITMAACLTVASSFPVGKWLWHYQDYRDQQTAVQLSAAGFQYRADSLFSALYPHLYMDNGFMLDYVHTAINLGHYHKASQLLNTLCSRDSHSLYYRLLGKCMQEMGKPHKAVYYFQQAVWQVPNRFVSRHELMQQYVRLKQYGRARQVATELLQLPVKIPSRQTGYFRSSAQQLLKKIPAAWGKKSPDTVLPDN